MLKQRIWTALILIPIFVLLVVKLSAQAFCIFSGAIVLWAGFEWSALMGVKSRVKKLIYPLILLVVLFGSLWLRIPNAIYAAAVWWIFATLLIVSYPRLSDAWGNSIIVRGIMGGFVLVPCWLALNFIRNSNNGTFILLFLFVLIWGADTGAYFAGKKWGKHKVAPLVSPGKSWQGVLGGLLLAWIATVGVLLWFGVGYSQWFGTLAVATITVIFSVIGDLFESMLKRKVDLKDSGTLLPGHGGMLDRIDSLTAAAPIFVLGLLVLQRFAV